LGVTYHPLDQPLHRERGVTSSERRLLALCERTFLTLWSHPSIYRDQGAAGGAREGKEVCDLVVVFENSLILFSDKSSDFPDTGDLTVDWGRWFRRAILRSARQLRGAERWIKAHPNRLFLDRACSTRFPYEMPSDLRVHRIVVAAGAGARCREELGGNGSLMIVPGLGPAASSRGDYPFSVGRPDDGHGYVHVLDDFSLDVVLETVSTVADFVSYLSAKERFIESGRLISAAGEEELLSFYLKDVNAEGKHDFVVPPNVHGVVLAEGHWRAFQTHPQRLAQLEADEVSYTWDRLIERFTHFATTAGLEHANYRTLDDFEKSVRFMAREPRTKRRLLAKRLLEMVAKCGRGERATRVLLPTEPEDPYYVFLALDAPANKPVEEYRTVRRELLECLCLVVRFRWPAAADIVGIATDSSLAGDDRSEDLIYMDGRFWTAELEADAKRLQKDLGLLTDTTKIHGRESDYPEIESTRSAAVGVTNKVGRNQLCPCGSGIKFKKCCGRAGGVRRSGAGARSG